MIKIITVPMNIILYHFHLFLLYKPVCAFNGIVRWYLSHVITHYFIVREIVASIVRASKAVIMSLRM